MIELDVSSSSVSTRQRRSTANITIDSSRISSRSAILITDVTTAGTHNKTQAAVMVNDDDDDDDDDVPTGTSHQFTHDAAARAITTTANEVTKGLTIIVYSERRDDIQTMSSVSNGNPNIQNQNRSRILYQRTKRKRQRKRANFVKYNDISFLWLFLKVGCVVCFIGYTVLHHHRFSHNVSIQQQQQSTTTTISKNIDDDYDNNNSHNEYGVTTDTHNSDTSSSVNDPQQPLFLFQRDHEEDFKNDPKQHHHQRPHVLNDDHWNLSSYAVQFDAYAIAELYERHHVLQHQKSSMTKTPTHVDQNDNQTSTNSRSSSESDLILFWQAATGLRTQFAELYGGTNVARAILDRATTTFGSNHADNHQHHTTKATTLLPVLPDDLYVTACRVWSSKQHTLSRSDNTPTFRFAFGGYSVTVGRGNLFSQSFPFVMEQQLQTVFSLLGIQLQVRNAAMYVHFYHLIDFTSSYILK